MRPEKPCKSMDEKELGFDKLASRQYPARYFDFGAIFRVECSVSDSATCVIDQLFIMRYLTENWAYETNAR
jgi:hypothetical protein